MAPQSSSGGKGGTSGKGGKASAAALGGEDYFREWVGKKKKKKHPWFLNSPYEPQRVGGRK